MSKTIDERVVEMRFDNQHFERNVNTTMSTLDKLKQSLKLTDASKGFENINTAASRTDLSPLMRGIEGIRDKFSIMNIAATTAIANIVNSAVNAGKRIADALTIKPIRLGFQEYETQINAVQTILANTESKGSTLQDVNRALDELNTYADKTIYNFTQMTKNIGTFTAAGVDLDKSVSAIKGIANLAAVSGSTSQQASTAMYQLSQALAAGRVSLMDWNSVVNAGMGGQVFQDALKRTSEVLGTGAEAAIKKYGSFRESLTQGKWLTVDVLTKTLEQFTMAAEEGSEQWELYKKSLKEQGYTEQQATEILNMANTATDAATKVKTYTQLIDTLMESAQSGWTQSWEIIMGDFGEAKEFYTEISDVIGNMITASADARNEVLSGGLSTGWKQLLNAGIADEAGFVDTIKTVSKEHKIEIDKMIADEKKLDKTLSDSEAFNKVLKKGLSEGTISSDILSKSIDTLATKMSKMSSKEREQAGYTADHVTQIVELNKGIKEGSISIDDFAQKIARSSGRENIIDALWNSFNAVLAIIKPVKEAFHDVFPTITGDHVYSLTQKIKEFTEGFKVSADTADKIKRTFTGVFSVFETARKILTSFAKAVGEVAFGGGISSIADLLLTITASVGDFLTNITTSIDTNGISGLFSGIASGVTSLFNAVSGSAGAVEGVLSNISNFTVKAFGFIKNTISEALTWFSDSFTALDLFAGLVGGSLLMVAPKLSGLIGGIKDKFEDGGILSLLFGGKKGEGETTKLKDIMGSVKEAFGSLGDSLQAFTSSVKIVSLVAIAAAVAILSSALRNMAGLKVADISKSLFAIGILISALMLSFKSLNKTLSAYNPKGMISAGIALILLAKAVDILADAMVTISELSLPDLIKGLFGVGVAIGELVTGLKIIDNVNIKLTTSIALIALANACKTLGDALTIYAKLSWSEIGRGLTAMGGALAEFVIAIKVLDNTSGFNTLLSSIGLSLIIQSMDELAHALQEFGSMSWDAITRGLVAMGGALAELGTTVGLLGKIVGFSSIIGSVALVIGVEGLGGLADALKKFGDMAWDTIARGLVAMGGALAELATTLGLLGKLTGFSGVIGSVALLIGVKGLGGISENLSKFGKMSWSEIARGLTAMGGALAELATTLGLLGKLAGFSSIIGSVSTVIGSRGLGSMADALKKFGGMSWSEIGRGLTAMGGALAELATITGVLGTLAPLGGLIGSGSILLGVQGLGDLADALKKFGEMSWGEIGRGLTAMGAALLEIAAGSFINTVGIIGSMTISEIARPLGDLADSMKKWTDVKVPAGLGFNLSSLAFGVTQFTLGGLGALTISTLAEPLGVLAESIKKWKDVTISEDLPGKVSSLAGAIGAYTFGGLGASAIAEAAPAVGTMADSIKKWKDVVVPDNLDDNLTNLSAAIKSFSFAFMGGWSLSSVAAPLGTMAESIVKWKDVVVPDDLDTDLEDLSKGIKAFSWAFMGGWSISSIAAPLGTLAESIMKWKDVTIPTNLGTNLESIGEAVKNLPTTGGIYTISSPFKKLADAIVDLAGTNMQGVSVNLTDLATSINNFVNVNEDIKNLGSNISTLITGSINTLSVQLEDAGEEIMAAVGKGIKNKTDSVKSSINTVIGDAIDGVSDKKTSMTTLGKDLAQGLINGLKDPYKLAQVYNAGFALGQKAVQGEKDGQDSNSPSKETYQAGLWIGEGLINGMVDMGRKVYNAGHGVGEQAAESITNTVSKISNAINTNIDSQPTIRPVLDLSDIQNGASNINNMLGFTPSVGVLATANGINSRMNALRQNRANDDVVDAINNLNGRLDNVGGTSYSINGINYSGDSAIAEAIETIVRAIKIEGRM